MTRIEKIRRGIDTLFSDGSLVELRIPKASTGTVIGYFYDRDNLAAAIESYSGNVQAVYYTLNTPSPELYDLTSAKDKAVAGVNGCKDDQIVCRNWMLVDCDPIRQQDDQKVSASDAEKSAALETLQKIHGYLAELGWPAPVSADSGNGYHLLYNLGGMENTHELTATIKNVLDHLAQKFNDAFVKVDTSVHNPSRITKAYGSLAGKGENTAERPHRYSEIRKVPAQIVPVQIEQLRALVPVHAPAQKHIIIKGQVPSKIATGGTEPEKMEEFLDYYGIDHKVARREKNGWSWELFPCPFNETHNIGEVGISLGDDGKYGFKCFHESCQDKHWQEFKAHLELTSGKKFFFKTNLKDAIPMDAKATSKMVLKRASAITPEVLTWLWPNRIPFGKLTLFAGHPGIGKGMCTMYVASCASTGNGWADQPNTNAPIESLIISSEDSPGDTLVPRLMAAGADMDKIAIFETMKTDKGEKAFGLDVDLPALHDALQSNPNIKLVIIDPIMNHLGGLKGNVEQELRSALTPLAKLAEKFSVAIVLVTHFNKSIGQESIQRVGGAMGMVGAVRVAWTFTEDPQDGSRKMLPLKANIAPDTGGLVYKIVSKDVEINGQSQSIGHIVFGDATHSSVEASLKNTMGNAPKNKIDEAKEWLQDFMSDGNPRLVDEIQLSANSMGFNKTTLSNAAIKIGCTVNVNENKTYWFLAKAE